MFLSCVNVLYICFKAHFCPILLLTGSLDKHVYLYSRFLDASREKTGYRTLFGRSLYCWKLDRFLNYKLPPEAKRYLEKMWMPVFQLSLDFLTLETATSSKFIWDNTLVVFFIMPFWFSLSTSHWHNRTVRMLHPASLLSALPSLKHKERKAS